MVESQVKYRSMFETLKAEVLGGKYASSGKLPSEAQLMRRFAVSRATVVRALQELRSKGLVVRRKGQGTFLAPNTRNYGRTIGVVIPISRGEIFSPICREVTRLAQQDGHAILLADFMAAPPERRVSEARRIAEDFVARDVVGVVFHLTDGVSDAARINAAALEVLDAMEIPVVLTDCDLAPFPQHSRYDVVGADDVDAGYRVTRHLLAQGARRCVFFMPEFGSTSFANRARGFQAALDEAHLRGATIAGDSKDVASVQAVLRRHRPDAILCGNDRVAADMLETLAALGRRVPQDIRLAGFDDVNFARFVSPRLTTVHAPCAEIGRAAYETLRARIMDVHAPARTVTLFAPLVVRESCGAEPPPQGRGEGMAHELPN